MNVKKTHEEFVKELSDKNPNIEVLEQYVNSRNKILVKCKVCGHEWTTMPSHLLSGRGCPGCSGRCGKTHDAFVAELLDKNSNIEVLGVYMNARTRVSVRCKCCNYEWNAVPGNLLRGSGCLKCSGKMKMTHEEFVAKLAEVNPDVEVLGKYTGMQNKVLVKCKVCAYEWYAMPYSLLQGHGCPRCVGVRRKTCDEFVIELCAKNPNIKVLGDYRNNHTKILVKCTVCGHEWNAAPTSLLRGMKCISCARRMG